MNKTSVKNFSIWARTELKKAVALKAYEYGITSEAAKAGTIKPSAQVQALNGGLLNDTQRYQRDALLREIKNKGYEQVIEEVAYTWFNRFIALKYMEVHGYLPVSGRVLPGPEGQPPVLTAEALKIDLVNIERGTIACLLERNDTEGLYKYMLIALCNQLHGKVEDGKTTGLPEMFQKISDHTELLFPDGLLKPGSVLTRMATDLDDDDWKDIEIVGWMYQYYNTELKDETFDLLKKNVKITKERIGAATQLFTPEWIVRYMVQNSLGRLWLEGHPNQNLRDKWQYYLDEVQQEPEVEEQLKKIREGYATISPEDITILDPCMGSGHILVYAFDLLMDIYRGRGYTDRDATACIVQKNLYGLDIDDRAAQLAYFAVMMKALEYDSRFLRRGIQPNLCAIEESNSITAFDRLSGQMGLDSLSITMANDLILTFHDAKIYGSILDVRAPDESLLSSLMDKLLDASLKDMNVLAWYEDAARLLPQLLKQARIMARKYDVVVTNPPYMTNSSMTGKLSNYLNNSFPTSRHDLYAVFNEKMIGTLKSNGLLAIMTSYTWMFLVTYSDFRMTMLKNNSLYSLIQPEYHSFFDEAYVPISTYVWRKSKYNYVGVYIRLQDFYGYDIQNVKALEAIHNYSCAYRYHKAQNDFHVIPGSPIAYWLNPKLLEAFNQQNIGELAEPKVGLQTGDNDRFIREWFEVDKRNIFTEQYKPDFLVEARKWFPYNKGGVFRKWYGNIDLVVDWGNDGVNIKKCKDPITGKIKSRPQNTAHYFREGFSWTTLTVGPLSVRYMPAGQIFDTKGSACFSNDKIVLYNLLGLLNSCISKAILDIISPTMDYGTGAISKIPVYQSVLLEQTIYRLVHENIIIARIDWDMFETSWDFQRHPLVSHQIRGSENTQISGGKAYVETSFKLWQMEAQSRFDQLKANEEELNRIFIDIYGLQGELSPEVEEKDVTVRRVDLKRDIRSLVSYAVGCMFGRYSLDVEGLAYAGGEWDESKYTTFAPDKDTIVPITDDEYFGDDIVTRFVSFIRTVYSAETLEENLRYIAAALGSSGNTSREVLRNYFLHDFYPDHCRVYQKRPIYWLFDSGKEDGFKALVYLHRYNRDTLARLRTDYVHELQERLRTQLTAAQKLSNTGDTRQKGLASKRINKLSRQIVEVGRYEEILHHMADQRIELDLDDGVAVNYDKMGDLVAKIK